MLVPLKMFKTDDGKTLHIERSTYTKRYVLEVNRDLCKGCATCEQLCHTGAITVTPREKEVIDGEERAVKAWIDIDERVCDHCGMCESICPYNVITHTVNGEPIILVVEKGSFPEYIREVKIDESKLDSSHVETDGCPLDLITVKADGGTEVELDLKHCPCCTVCETTYPTGAFIVSPIFRGKIDIHQEKCPKGCHDCVDVCPIDGALEIQKGGKVYPNDRFCIYCGACVKVCPEPEALDVIRHSIRHTPVKSGAWHKALETLTDISGYERELRIRRTAKLMEALQRKDGTYKEE
jgi:4Fe-4S ferredoxin